MNIPQVPETLEGWAVLHQMFRVRWPAWRALEASERTRIAQEASAQLSRWEEKSEGPSACFSLLGHKGDLMLLHFRPSFDDLVAAELELARLELYQFLEPTTSYLSIVELGMYADTVKKWEELRAAGIEPGSAEWRAGLAALCAEKSEAMHNRLFPAVPNRRYLCFYPMDKKRGEEKNWYNVPIGERASMMREHGMVGRLYAGKVTQIISGSIGFDDWEWGVDLFARDPVVFKKLVYEMRFDEASADYGLFGKFYLGLRFPAAKVGQWLDGTLPSFGDSA